MVGSFPLQGEESQCWRMARFPLTIAPCTSAVQQCRLAGISQASGCSRLVAVARSSGLGDYSCRDQSSELAGVPAARCCWAATWGHAFGDGTQVRKVGSAQPLGVGTILRSCCSQCHVRRQLGLPACELRRQKSAASL